MIIKEFSLVRSIFFSSSSSLALCFAESFVKSLCLQKIPKTFFLWQNFQLLSIPTLCWREILSFFYFNNTTTAKLAFERVKDDGGSEGERVSSVWKVQLSCENSRAYFSTSFSLSAAQFTVALLFARILTLTWHLWNISFKSRSNGERRVGGRVKTRKTRTFHFSPSIFFRGFTAWSRGFSTTFSHSRSLRLAFCCSCLDSSRVVVKPPQASAQREWKLYFFLFFFIESHTFATSSLRCCRMEDIKGVKCEHTNLAQRARKLAAITYVGK